MSFHYDDPQDAAKEWRIENTVGRRPGEPYRTPYMTAPVEEPPCCLPYVFRDLELALMRHGEWEYMGEFLGEPAWGLAFEYDDTQLIVMAGVEANSVYIMAGSGSMGDIIEESTHMLHGKAACDPVAIAAANIHLINLLNLH